MENHEADNKAQVSRLLSRLKDAVLRQPARFRKRGYGILFGFLQLLGIFWLLPKVLTLIWPYVLVYFSHKLIYILGLIIINLSVIVLLNLIFLAIYRMKHPFFEQHRIYNKPWPWEVNYEKWRQFLSESLKNVAVNICIVSPLFIFVDMQHNFCLKFQMEEIPCKFAHNQETTTIIWQIGVFILVQDLSFYLAHRAFHHPKLYWIHKRHHQYINTISIATQYAHPIEFILANLIPTGLGSKLLSMIYPTHMITFLIWVVFRLIQAIQGHGGYEWPWSITSFFPIGTDSEYHNFHHTHNSGNFGSLTVLWDTLFRTNRQFQKLKEQKAEKQKQKVLEKVARSRSDQDTLHKASANDSDSKVN